MWWVLYTLARLGASQNRHPGLQNMTFSGRELHPPTLLDNLLPSTCEPTIATWPVCARSNSPHHRNPLQPHPRTCPAATAGCTSAAAAAAGASARNGSCSPLPAVPAPPSTAYLLSCKLVLKNHSHPGSVCGLALVEPAGLRECQDNEIRLQHELTTTSPLQHYYGPHDEPVQCYCPYVWSLIH